MPCAPDTAKGTTMATTDLPAITRRTFFFGSAAGALTLLGVAHTEFGLVAAYADESDETSFSIVMLGRDEIAVLGIDPSTSKVVPNMKVRVTTHAADAKQESIELTTNEQGFATARVRDMSEDCDDDQPVGGYGFWARVEGSAEGYRDFAAEMVRVQTGPAPKGQDGRRAASITVPTQPFDAASQPGYLRTLSFDGNDIQYTDATFAACAGNDVDHTLELQIVAAAGKRVAARFIYDGAELGSATGTTDAQGLATMRIEGAFLKSAQAGKKAQVFFEIENAQFEAPCRLAFREGAGGLSDALDKDDATISPGNPDSNPMADGNGAGELGAYTVFVPEKFPIGGGTKFDLPLPDFPVTVQFNPLGMAAIGLGLDLKKLLPSANGKGGGNTGWKAFKAESWEDYKERRYEEQVAAVERYLAAESIKKGKGGSVAQTKFGGLDTKFDFTLLAEGDWQWGSSTWSLGLNATILFNLKYSWGRQVFVGAIPAYVGFDIALNNSAVFYIGMEMDSGFEDIHWTPDRNGVTIVSRFEVGVSAGVGVPGLLSVGARGYGFLQGTLGLVKTDKPFPHLALGAGAGITLVWQVLFASGTIGLYNHQWPHILDNWPSESFTLGEERELSVPAAFANSNATYMLGQGDTLDLESCPPALITPADLVGLAEFDAQVDEVAAEDGTPDLSLEYGYLAQKETLACFSETGVVSADEAALTAAADDSEYLPSLGAVPSVDRRIYEGVTSDSRHKVVRSADGSWYLCRLCVVNVKVGLLAGADRNIVFNPETGLFERLPEPQTVLAQEPQPAIARPRVTVSKLLANGSWGAPQVVDFNVASNPVDTLRANFYDYDFSVCEDLANPGTFFFNIVSGRVGAAGEDSFKYRWRNQCVTFVKYQYDRAKTLMQVSLAGKLGTETCYAPYVFYHAATKTPLFTWVSAELGDDEDAGVVYKLNANAYDETLEYPLGQGDYRPYSWTAAPTCLDFYAGRGPRWTGEEDRPVFVWVAPALDGAAPVANAYQVHPCSYDCKYHAMGWGVTKLKDVTRPVIVPDRGWIYTDTTDDAHGDGPDERTGDMRELTFVTRTAAGKKVERKVGIANMTSFGASPDGSRLFAVRCEEGELPSTLAADLNPGVDSEVVGVDEESGPVQVNRYAAYAANWDEKRQSYHKFYPFCQSEHPLDVVDCVELGRGEVNFIATEIVDAQAGKGDIYQINVPLLCSIQLVSATTMDLFCGPGDTCHVTVRVQNNGNLPLTAFGVLLFDNQDPMRRPLASKVFDNLADDVCPAVEEWRYNDEDGNGVYMSDEVYLASKAGESDESGALRGSFSAEDMNSLLWPGDERSYGTIDFTIPDSWAGKGEVEIYACVLQPKPDEDALADALGQVGPDFGGAGTQASADASGFGAASGSAASDENGVFFDVDGVDESFTLKISDETVAAGVSAADYTPVNSAAAAADAAQQKKKAVDTGDDAAKSIGSLAAVGVGAAAVAAAAAHSHAKAVRTECEAAGAGASVGAGASAGAGEAAGPCDADTNEV